MIVEKYGGSSLATLEKINLIAYKIKERVLQGEQLVVITSAMGKTTNYLIAQARELDSKVRGRELDSLMATGENQAAALLSIALNKLGIKAISLNAYQAGIYATDEYQTGFITKIDVEQVRRYLSNYDVVVVTGFQGINERYEIVTLGRGGSDTTAVALAATLKCPCYIYTDVDGVYTVDPRLYPNSQKLDEVSYDEMIELASCGSGVIVTRAALLAKYYQVPTIILHSVDGGGTKLVNETLEKREILGISVKSNLIYIKIKGEYFDEKIIGSIFELISKNDLLIGMVYHDSNRNLMAFTINKNDELKFNEVILELKSHPEIGPLDINKEYEFDKVSIVGHGVNQYPHIISNIYTELSKVKIHLDHMTSSEMAISLMINKKDLPLALDILVKAFNLGKTT